MCSLISKICDTGFENDLIKKNTRGKTIIKTVFLCFASQCESIFTSIHKSNTNFYLFPRNDVVNPIKLLFLLKMKFSYIIFLKHVQISSFSYVSCKNCIYDGPNGTMKGPNIGTIESKNQRNQCDF